MAFAAHVLYALIASPGDTLRARDAIEHAINAWNSDRAKSAGVVLLPRRWETDSVPLLGGDDGQSVINKQLVDEADIIFGVFHSRLGRKTARGVSGTAEEIARASSAKKQVHVYFAEMPHPPDVDPEQLAALKAFKATMEDQGLYGSFASEEELKAKVRTAIEYDLEHFSLGKAQPSTRGDAVILRARYESRREQYSDSKGRIKSRTRGEKLVVENRGTVTARQVHVSLEPIGEGEAPVVHDSDVRVDVIPDSHVSYILLTHMGVSSSWRVTMYWLDEQGDEHSEVQTVSWM